MSLSQRLVYQFEKYISKKLGQPINRGPAQTCKDNSDSLNPEMYRSCFGHNAPFIGLETHFEHRDRINQK